LIAVCCFQGDEEAVDEVKDILTDSASDLDAIMAEALSSALDDIERMNRLSTTEDARRHKALAEMERRRDTLRRHRTTDDDIIDVPLLGADGNPRR
jgi:hypothetical protein